MSGQNTNITKNIGSLQGLTISNIGDVTTTTSVAENNNISNSTAQMYGDIILKVSDDLYTSIQEDSSGGIVTTDSIEKQQKYRKRITYFSDTALHSSSKQLKEGTYIEFGPNGPTQTSGDPTPAASCAPPALPPACSPAFFSC